MSGSLLMEERRLRGILHDAAPLAIAFSGGVDSSLLAAVAADEIGSDSLLLIHAESILAPKRESSFAIRFAEKMGLRLKLVRMEPLSIPGVLANGRMRCYHCKRMIMAAALEAMKTEGMRTLADGANTDDLSDWRPGMKACDELGVRHPFMEAGIGKRRIRLMARRLGLDNWRSPAAACMASRFPCGTTLEADLLEMTAKAEDALLSRGFPGARVRCLPGRNAKIEANPLHLKRLFKCREELAELFSSLGFNSVSIDLRGYRQGSMN